MIEKIFSRGYSINKTIYIVTQSKSENFERIYTLVIVSQNYKCVETVQKKLNELKTLHSIHVNSDETLCPLHHSTSFYLMVKT